MLSFDHLILGTGQATGTLLGKIIPTGESIAVIEGAAVGGSCVNYGCTPTKAMVASARAIHLSRRGEEFGFSTGPLQVNFPRIRERMNGIRYGARDGLTQWMEETSHLSLIRGWGTFESEHVIRVGEERIAATRIYINTGTRPFLPPVEGIDEVPWMDSAGLLDLEELPEHLLILGGGYIGLEFAQVYRRFGSRVTIVNRDPQVMPREDEDIASAVQEILEGEGVRVINGATANQVWQENDRIHLQYASDKGEETVQGTHLLVAAGRQPNSDQLNLAEVGIKTSRRGYILVDDFCRTGVEGVFALGDVNGHGAFTHTSVNDAEIVLDHLYGGSRRLSSRITIYGLFTDPPLGRVGLSEKEALASGRPVLKATRPMREISRAKEMSETQGFAKLLVDEATDLILGAAVLGPGGDEVINMFAAIMHSHIPCRNYREVVLVHPTVSELMPWVLDGLEPVN